VNLYDTNKKLSNLLEKGFDEDCIDYETGEILEDKAKQLMAELAFDESVKIENTALFIKNLEAEAEAIKAEEKSLADRRKAKECKIEWLKNYLTGYLLDTGKTKFETAKTAISFRRSEVLTITDEKRLLEWLEKEERYLRYKMPEINKSDIKTALKQGENIPYVVLEQKQNIQVR